mmetsp:Transcript_17490/g.45019  ORF Transcript_17490/g.45019 Transcript_17490/m.45019 type:complete len:268 (+) Transcript_17490:278-1081(+)
MPRVDALLPSMGVPSGEPALHKEGLRLLDMASSSSMTKRSRDRHECISSSSQSLSHWFASHSSSSLSLRESISGKSSGHGQLNSPGSANRGPIASGGVLGNPSRAPRRVVGRSKAPGGGGAKASSPSPATSTSTFSPVASSTAAAAQAPAHQLATIGGGSCAPKTSPAPRRPREPSGRRGDSQNSSIARSSTSATSATSLSNSEPSTVGMSLPSAAAAVGDDEGDLEAVGTEPGATVTTWPRAAARAACFLHSTAKATSSCCVRTGR